jgi:hypothetical protein
MTCVIQPTGRQERCIQRFDGEDLKKKRELGKRKHRWKKNITPKVGLQELRWSMDFIDLAQDRDRWRAVMNFLVPYKKDFFV